MQKTSRPLVLTAIRALDKSSRDLLRKAAHVARAFDASVRLVHVIAIPYGPAMGARRPEVRRAADDELNDRKSALAKLASGPELRGVETSVSVVWDYPPAEGLIREVLKTRPALLLAESQRKGRLARVFLTNTDWELIRNCPCPLWLSKTAKLSARGAVIAALDPLHSNDKPAALDQIILRHALEAAGDDPRRVLACHAYPTPIPVPVDGVVEAYWGTVSEAEREAHRKQVERAIARAVRSHEIPAQNTIVVTGDPAVQLPRLAKKHAANVIVMGAVSRRGLKRIFIGNTAERLIDEAPCDVLIVKPRGFKTPVARRKGG